MTAVLSRPPKETRVGQRDVGAWVNFASAPTPHGFGQQFVDAAALQVGERGLSWRGGGVGHERGSGMAETFLNPFHIENKQKRFDDNTTYHLRAVARGGPITGIFALIRAAHLPPGRV